MNKDQQPDGTLALSGSIDENANLIGLVNQARGKLVLDLGGVTFINSLGVRDWIRMVSAATQKQLELELRRVCEPIVHQLNMIVATRGSARVASFYAPYACDACGREESMIVDTTAHRAELGNLQAPAQKCPECGATMVFNDFPERYFSFLSSAPGA